jgi:hypothetical protein
VIEPDRAEDLADRLARGEPDDEALRWVCAGFAARSRAGGAVSLERCLRLRSTPFQRRVRQRNAWLSEAARLLAAEPGEGSIARRVHQALDRFQTRGLWASWKGQPSPPEGAAALHTALFWTLKLNAGQALSHWHIGDLLRGIQIQTSHAETASIEPVTSPPHSKD